MMRTRRTILLGLMGTTTSIAFGGLAWASDPEPAIAPTQPPLAPINVPPIVVHINNNDLNKSLWDLAKRLLKRALRTRKIPRLNWRDLIGLGKVVYSAVLGWTHKAEMATLVRQHWLRRQKAYIQVVYTIHKKTWWGRTASIEVIVNYGLVQEKGRIYAVPLSPYANHQTDPSTGVKCFTGWDWLADPDPNSFDTIELGVAGTNDMEANDWDF